MEKGIQIINAWYKHKKWKPFEFQLDVRNAYLAGNNGLLNAPTGSGKTYALFLPVLLEYMAANPDFGKPQKNGLQLIWITPLRALTQDIKKAMETACAEMGIAWKIAVRSGDTSTKERNDQKKQMPEVLLTTPESIQIMLAQKDYALLFGSLKCIVIDEWHELLGTKRAVQLELSLSRIRAIFPEFKTWAISATIGNLEEAAEVLLGSIVSEGNYKLIKANIKKKTIIRSIIPEEIEKFSWAGHLGIKLLPQVMPIIEKSGTTLLFTNTRSQTEIWYQAILANYPEYAGIMAMHHGSIDGELRTWVENALHEGILKVVVCTSSLDLGVDFRPVDTVIQIGSPKGISRFMQRAGRSGHHPGATSVIYFVPTHTLELTEGAALKQAMTDEIYESRDPIVLAMDVLTQYLVTLAVSDGFYPKQIFEEIKKTHAYADLEKAEFESLLSFITVGGDTLSQYDEYLKVDIEPNGLYKVNSRKIAMRHRMSIGTIVSELSMSVQFVSGGRIGTIEESFIAKLKPGNVFWFAGRSLEFLNAKGMVAYVRKSSKKTGIIPSWAGGRMPLSSQLSKVLRDKINEVAIGIYKDEELIALKPLMDLQENLSKLPCSDELLIEIFISKEGTHIFVYPFEGRLVHEGMASLLSYRLTQTKPMSFSLAMNDYGFEILTDSEVPKEFITKELFSTENLLNDILHSLNANELARRKFRDIANIAGLVFTGFPGKNISNKHLQASTSLLFDVFEEYEPNNLLVKQAYNEALTVQLEEFRMREALLRIAGQKLIIKEIKRPTPFAFPIMVDSLNREKLSTESLEERIKKMQIRYEKA